MHFSQDTKTIPLAPASIASNATATLIVDCRGFSEAQCIWNPQTASATTRILALKVEEGDATNAFSDITGYVGGTNSAGGFTFPTEVSTAATAVQPYVLNLDLKGKKRYLRFSFTPGATTVVGAVCNLSRPATAPDKVGEAIASRGTDGGHVAGNTTLGVVVNPGGALPA